MAPATSSPAATQKLFPFKGSVRRTEAPRRPSLPARKYKSMAEIMATAKYVVIERADYSDARCVQCGSGSGDDELLLCDKCDRGFHMSCLRPIVVRIPIGTWLCPSCSGQRRGRSTYFFFFFFLCFFREKKNYCCFFLSVDFGFYITMWVCVF